MTTESQFRIAVVALLDPPVDGRVAVDETPMGDWPYPHIVISWQITDASALDGDAKSLYRRREFQVDLRQRAEAERAGSTTAAEVIQGLNGAKAAGQRLKVVAATRQIDPTDKTVVRHILTVWSPTKT